MKDDHATLLSLAKHAITVENSAIWKLDAEEAMRIHGEACDAVWAELKRQVAARQDISPTPPPKEQVAAVRAEAIRRLKDRLPELITEAIGEIL